MVTRISVVLLLFIVCEIVSGHVPEHRKRCGHNDIIKPPRGPTAFQGYENHPWEVEGMKRDISSARWENIRIRLDTSQFRAPSRFLRDVKTLVLEEVQKKIQKLIKVVPVAGKLTIYTSCESKNYDGSCKDGYDYSYCGPASVPKSYDSGVYDTDLLIFVLSDTSSETSAVAYASSCQWDQHFRATVGYIVFGDSKSDIANNPVLRKYYIDTGVHEIFHVLGFTNTDFDGYFRDSYGFVYNPPRFSHEIVDGVRRPVISFPHSLEVARLYFGCPTLQYIPLEESGGDGSIGSHLDGRVFAHDNMQPAGSEFTGYEEVSPIALAILQDSGWYRTDHNEQPNPYWGQNMGCSFITDKCFSGSGRYNPPNMFPRHWCTLADYYNATAKCRPGRRSYGTCGLYTLEVPAKFRYFNTSDLGGDPFLEYCPMYMASYQSRGITQYEGICNGYIKRGFSSSSYNRGGETYGESSRCFESTVRFKKNYRGLKETPGRACYKVTCFTNEYKVQIGNISFTCKRPHEVKRHSQFYGSFVCAPYDEVCD